MIYDFLMEYRVSPIALDTAPRFSWKLKSEGKNVLQIAYQIQVMREGRFVWESGRVDTEQSILIPYGGEALMPFSVYQVKVSAWDNLGELHETAGRFETGLMDQPWQARWITHSLSVEETFCPVFVRGFSLSGAIRRARLYATACGMYEAAVNGTKAGDAFFAPGWTSYHNRVQYQTYDITDLVKPGDNEITITLGNGWYKSELGFDARPNIYGDRTALMAMLRVEYEDGTVAVFGTDENWDVKSGPIRFSEIYHGETQDLTLPAKLLGKAALFKGMDTIGRIVAQESEPVRVTRRFPVREKIVTPKGEIVFDFGQNMTGLVEVTLPKLTGEKLVIRHAETLDKDGNFYTENLRTARCSDTYTYGDADVGRVIMPHFTFHGFRYICVEGTDADVDASRFTACAMHTDMRETGSFRTDNKLITQLQSNIQWGQRDNFVDIPTDCPQRDERLGWTGDAQVFCGTASFNFNTALFFRKWMRDMAVESSAEWGVPHVVPNILGNQDSAAAWSDAAAIIPWKLYQVYGDRDMLREQYPMMKLWVDYIHGKTSANGLWQTGFQYGDWLALDGSYPGGVYGGTDPNYIASAYYCHSTRIVARAAHVLGYAEDAAYYDNLAEEIRAAFVREYFTPSGRLAIDTMTGCVLALVMDLAPDYAVEQVRGMLLNRLQKNFYHLNTGFTGTPYLCRALSENGMNDIAYHLLLEKGYPGWLYEVLMGATTIWERWNSVMPDGKVSGTEMNSMNHYSYGSIVEWMFRDMLGINPMEDAPGFKRFTVAPKPNYQIGSAAAKLDSASGLIESEWAIEGSRLRFGFTVPFDTRAEIVLPDAEASVIEAQCQGQNVVPGSVRQQGADVVFTANPGRYGFTYAPTTPYRKVYSLDSSWEELKANPKAMEIIRREYTFKEDHIPFEKELCTLREMSWGPFTSMTEEQRQRIDRLLREVE